MRTDGHTDRHDEATSRVSPLGETLLKHNAMSTVKNIRHTLQSYPQTAYAASTVYNE